MLSLTVGNWAAREMPRETTSEEPLVTFSRTLQEHGSGIAIASLLVALVLATVYHALSNTLHIEQMERQQVEYRAAASLERSRILHELEELRRAIEKK